MSEPRPVTVVPGHFEPADHFYPRVLNAHLHPLVRTFFRLGNARIAERYCHLHPEVDAEAVRAALATETRWLRWAGADLFCTTDAAGRRQLVVIETNSSPSGQKSSPAPDDAGPAEQAGYRVLLEQSFLPLLRRRGLPAGDLAVLWDKNPMEASGYADVLADLTGEPVHLVPFLHDDPDPPARFVEGVLHVRDEHGDEHPVRAAFRYVTQRPWTRIPPLARTWIYNPVLACLAGGRNKMLAAKAYDLHNADLEGTGLAIHVPETIWDVAHDEVPLWVRRMGGLAVVKNPYSNAGQGVWPITSPAELEAFLALDQRYDRFIVQALIGNLKWSSRSRSGRLFHVGTVPDRRLRIYVADLRMMVGAGPEGFFPVALYARRAREPLAPTLEGPASPWDMLGTNLSSRTPDGEWTTDTDRLLLMDSKDFNRLGIGLDDLIEGYLQTVLAMTAVDRMASSLVNSKGRFRRRYFGTVNPDPSLLDEVCE